MIAFSHGGSFTTFLVLVSYFGVLGLREADPVPPVDAFPDVGKYTPTT